MKLPTSVDWPPTPKDAVALQRALAGKVETRDRLGNIRHVAGVDVAFADGGKTTRAAVTVLKFPELDVVDSALAEIPTTFPYVPGLLSFRELPAILAALGQLKVSPDLIHCDGHGFAHPRRFGIACHLGVLIDTPTLGVGKSRLCGEEAAPGPRHGDRAPLTHKGETIGTVLRTRDRVRPVYVSIGHRISLESAVASVLACTTKYRLPETTRSADKLSKTR